MEKIKQNKIIRDSSESIRDMTSKINRKARSTYRDSKKLITRQGRAIIRDGKSVVRSGLKTARDAKKLITQQGEAIINDGKYTAKKIKQDWTEFRGSTDAKDVGDIAPFKYNTKGIYNFNQSAKLIEKKGAYEINRDAYREVCTTKDPGSPHCATAVTNRVLEIPGGGKTVSKFNLRGSGWQMLDNVQKAGGKKVVDIFDLSDKPSSYNLNNIKKFISTAATKPEHVSAIKNNVEAGDIVALYYPASGSFERAYRETNGKTMNTHIGDIVEIEGKKYVRDNINNKYRYRPLETVLNNKDKEGVLITGLVKPKSEYVLYSSPQVSTRPKTWSKDNPTFENLFSKAAVRAMASIEKNKDSIIKINKITPQEFELVRDLSQAIMLKESNYGKAEGNHEYNFTSGRSKLGAVALPIKNTFAKIGLQPKESVGLGNVKLEENYTPVELKARGFDAVLDSGNRDAQESPEFSGVVTADHLSRTLKKVKSLLINTPNYVKNDKDLVISLVATAHNQGLDNIEKDIKTYKKTGELDKVRQYKKFSYANSIRTLNSYVTDNQPKGVLRSVTNNTPQEEEEESWFHAQIGTPVMQKYSGKKLKRDLVTSEQPIEEKVNYTVIKGDNLTKISKMYNVPLNTLIKLNKISDPDKIKIGQVIKISE